MMKRLLAGVCILGMVTGCSNVKVDGPHVTTTPYALSVQFTGTVPVDAVTLHNLPVPDGAETQAVLSVAEVALRIYLAKALNWKSCVFTPINALRPVMGAQAGTFTIGENATCTLDGAPISEGLQITFSPEAV